MSLAVEEVENDKLIYLDGHTDRIKETIGGIANDFVYIGFLLWEVRRYKYYLGKNYKDVVEYAEKELGFKRSSTFNFIAICEKFSKRTQSGNPSMSIDSQYLGFGYSKLTVMLSLSDAECKEVPSNATVQQIREIKKKKKEVSPNVWTDKKTLDNQLVVNADSKIVEVEEVEQQEQSQVGKVKNFDNCYNKLLCLKTRLETNLEFSKKHRSEQQQNWDKQNYDYICFVLNSLEL